MESAFQQRGDSRQPQSLGLTLVNTLTQQIDGTITLDNQQGCTFKITFANPTIRDGG